MTTHRVNQARPDKKTWNLWKKALLLFSDSSGRLHVPLRQWIVPPSRQRQVWPVYFDPSSNSLILRSATGFDYHRRRRRLFSYRPSEHLSSLPQSAYPVCVQAHPKGWTVRQYNSYCPSLPSAPPSCFSSFCSSLEPWEAQLLDRVHFHYEPFRLMEMLTDSHFRACSDGSAITLQGAYGWVLALKDGTRLAYGAGPVDGHNPNSFRAEGQGMLSVACLLRRLVQWTSHSSTLTGILATDNSGLVDRVTDQSIYKYPVPNMTFKPDWDIVQGIVATLASFPIAPTFRHVQGHQDRDQSIASLPLLAKLNVEADRHAGEYRDLHGRHRPIIPLSPTLPVALDIDGQTIHRAHKQAIREAASAFHLLQEMQLRYNWPDGTLEVIDWEVHRQATQAQHSRRTHYVKLCHEMLPTGVLVGEYGQDLPNYCALCKAPDENHHHVLLCPHSTREKWRKDFLNSLYRVCDDLRTDINLYNILHDGLSHWLLSTPFDPSAYPSRYQPLITDQTIIGWHQIFQGRISLKWAAFQQLHLWDLPPIKGQDGTYWSRCILSHVFTKWNLLWDTRNKNLHGVDAAAKAKATKDQALRELARLYTYKDKVLHRHRSLFKESLESHSLLPTRSIRQWINTYEPLLYKSAKDAKLHSLLHVRTLNHYFG